MDTCKEKGLEFIPAFENPLHTERTDSRMSVERGSITERPSDDKESLEALLLKSSYDYEKIFNLREAGMRQLFCFTKRSIKKTQYQQSIVSRENK